MTEPRYLPIPFLPAYGVDRDGVVCRLDPFRKVRPIPFHDALRKAAKHAAFRSVKQSPERLDSGVVAFPPAAKFDFVPTVGLAWWRWHSTVPVVPLRGDGKSGWYWLCVPLACPDGSRVEVNLLLHGPSVAAVVFSSRG
jgi:hypothetical protein